MKFFEIIALAALTIAARKRRPAWLRPPSGPLNREGARSKRIPREVTKRLGRRQARRAYLKSYAMKREGV